MSWMPTQLHKTVAGMLLVNMTLSPGPSSWGCGHANLHSVASFSYVAFLRNRTVQIPAQQPSCSMEDVASIGCTL